MRRISNGIIVAAVLAGSFGTGGCHGKKDGPPEVELSFGTFKSARCEIENPRDQFAIDEGMSMAVTSDRPFASEHRYQLYLSTLTEGPGGQQVKEEIDRILMDVDPSKSVFCAAGPKLTPKQFGIKAPGRYRIEFWLGEDPLASRDIVITGPHTAGPSQKG